MRASTISSSVKFSISLIINESIIRLTGVFGREALSLYNTENTSSLITGKISSAKGLAQDLSRNLFSLSVKLLQLSSKLNS